MRAPGLFDRQITDNVYTLQELAQQIVLEPGFARASVKFWWSSIMGSKVLLAPAVTEDNGYQAQLLAYEAQTATIEELAQDFSSHFNLKDLLVEMMMTPWFSAETVDDNTNIEAHIFAELGSEKLLTPERLQRKTLALTGFNWDSRPRKATTLDDLRTGFEYTYRLYYGGIDSLGITERSTEMTPLMSTVPMSAAAESSCPIVLKEFALADEERKLFFGITDLETPLLEANWETSVDSAEYGDWKDFSLNATVAAGEKIALVTFSNPYCDFDEVNKVCLEQRRLYLDYLSVKTPGQSTFTRYEADDSAVTISGCWLRGPEANDAVLDESCSVSLPISIATSGNLEIRVALSAMQGGDELPKARIALLDTVDPHESQSAGAVTIREKLAELHQILLGKTYAADSPEIAIAYNLLVDSWVEHESDGFATNLMHTGYQCRWDSDFTYFDNLDFADEGFVLNDAGFWFDGNVNVVFPFLVSIADDPQRMKRSWIVVMTYLMTHYHYLYE